MDKERRQADIERDERGSPGVGALTARPVSRDERSREEEREG